MTILVNGSHHEAATGERLVDAVLRAGIELPHVCYYPQLGPIQTCDTCMQAARTEAFDRILSHHLLYCTVCDNNNGNCVVHNTTKMMAIEHQNLLFKTKPYEVDYTNPFYRYDPDQCILCGRCVEACQNLEVDETLSIRWEDPNPRVLWDGGSTIGESSCVSCGHCVTVCPCNALMETSMLHHAGFLTGLSKQSLDGISAMRMTKSQQSRIEHEMRRVEPCGLLAGL
jgi:formate dehydrogenase major subunit